MPKSTEQFKELRAVKEKKIRDTALELFATNGFTNTSIALIAKEAGISKGLAYNYFKSKDDLLSSIIKYEIKEIYASFDRDHNDIIDNEEMEYFIRYLFETIKEKTSFYKLLIKLLSDEISISQLVDDQDEYLKKLGYLFYNYFNERFDDPNTEMLMFSSTVKGLFMQYVYSKPPMDDSLVEKCINRIIYQWIK